MRWSDNNYRLSYVILFIIYFNMSLDSVIEEMFDLVLSRTLTEEELREHIKYTYEISSNRIIDMILEWCEKRIKDFEESLWLLNYK